MKTISWNPSNPVEFAQIRPGQGLDILEFVVENGNRKINHVDSISATNISCFHWQNTLVDSLIGFGSSSGSVSIINRRNMTKTVLQIPKSGVNRLVNQISWNDVDLKRLAIGYDSVKSSEESLFIWDLSSEKFLRLPTSESCCSLSWIPFHDALLFQGNSMGWIKLFDLRCSSVGSVASWLSHPANRPRKVKGILPNNFEPTILSSFSDAVGDTVKVWDLRSIDARGDRRGGLPKGFSINPYNCNYDEYNNSIVTSASISDTAWSPLHSDTLAVATTNSRSIHFFRYDSTFADQSSPMETSVPLRSINSFDFIKALSWQYSVRVDSDRFLNDSFVKWLEKMDTTPVSKKWEEGGVELSQIYLRRNGIDAPILSNMSKKLLVLTSSGILETDARDSNPFAFSELRLIYQRSFSSTEIATIQRFFKDKECDGNLTDLQQQIESYLRNIATLMQDRANAGYSFEASGNVDIFNEEMEFFHRKISTVYTGKVATDELLFKVNEMTQQIQDIHRVWVWIDRVETSSHSTTLTVDSAGALNAVKPGGGKSETFIDPMTGFIMYTSEARSSLKRTCGWLNTENDKEGSTIENIPGKSSDSTSFVSSQVNTESKGLLEILVEDCSSSSFERAAILALWHGDLNLCVRILHETIQTQGNIQSVPLSNTDYNKHNDDDYFQTVALVAACIAGYSAQPDEFHRISVGMSSWNYKSSVQFDRSSWRATCNLTIQRLRKFKRPPVAYLIAGCNFLLYNAEGDKGEEYSFPYHNFFEDDRIMLEDKIAFASSFLNDDEFLAWASSCFHRCLASGVLEGLLLTGVSKMGIMLLQRYLDQTSDVQTVALISTRLMSGHGDSSFNEDSDIVSTALRWISCYRQLLIQWELYNERAHLDIEIHHHFQKLNEGRQKLCGRMLLNPLVSTLNAQNHLNDRFKGSLNVGKSSRSVSVPSFLGVFPLGLKESPKFVSLKLKCGFCGTALPADDLASKNMESLRTQKYLLQSCSNCTKPLPRCYICKLHMGTLNPYVKLKQAAVLHSSQTNPDNQKYSSRTKENLFKNRSQSNITVANHGGKLWDCSFDKWFLFCQKCRHGGHTACLSQWFNCSLHIIDSERNYKKMHEKQVCGVNGCNCFCTFNE